MRKLKPREGKWFCHIHMAITRQSCLWAEGPQLTPIRNRTSLIYINRFICTQMYSAFRKQIFLVGLLYASLVPGAFSPSPAGPEFSNIGGHSIPQSWAYQFSFGSSGIRIYLMSFLYFLVISAHNCLFKIRNFCGLAVKDHSEPQTNNFLLIICLWILLSHTPAQPSLMLSAQLPRQAAAQRATQNFLIQLRTVNTLSSGDPETYLRRGIPTPIFFQVVSNLQTSGRLIPLPPVWHMNHPRGPGEHLHSVKTISIPLCSLHTAVILRIRKKLRAGENEFSLKLLLKCEWSTR